MVNEFTVTEEVTATPNSSIPADILKKYPNIDTFKYSPDFPPVGYKESQVTDEITAPELSSGRPVEKPKVDSNRAGSLMGVKPQNKQLTLDEVTASIPETASEQEKASALQKILDNPDIYKTTKYERKTIKDFIKKAAESEISQIDEENAQIGIAPIEERLQQTEQFVDTGEGSISQVDFERQQESQRQQTDIIDNFENGLREFGDIFGAGEDFVKSKDIAVQSAKQFLGGLDQLLQANKQTYGSIAESIQKRDLTPIKENILPVFEKTYGGVVDAITGAVGTTASPFPALAPELVEKPVEKAAEFLGELGGTAAGALIEAGGGDVSSPIAQKTIQAAELLAQVLGFKKAGELKTKAVGIIKEIPKEFKGKTFEGVNIEKAAKETPSKRNEIADGMIMNANRITKGAITEFMKPQKSNGIAPAKWMREKGLIGDTRAGTVENLGKFFEESLNKKQKGVETVKAPFESETIPKMIEQMEKASSAEGLEAFDKTTKARFEGFKKEYAEKGKLSPKRALEFQRMFRENVEIPFKGDLTKGATIKKALRNLDAQFMEEFNKHLEKNGFAENKAISKDIQLSKYLMDEITKFEQGQQANNTLSLSDNIQLAAGSFNPSILAAWGIKKGLGTDYAQLKAAKFLETGERSKTAQPDIGKIKGKSKEFRREEMAQERRSLIEEKKRINDLKQQGKITQAKELEAQNKLREQKLKRLEEDAEMKFREQEGVKFEQEQLGQLGDAAEGFKRIAEIDRSFTPERLQKGFEMKKAKNPEMDMIDFLMQTEDALIKKQEILRRIQEGEAAMTKEANQIKLESIESPTLQIEAQGIAKQIKQSPSAIVKDLTGQSMTREQAINFLKTKDAPSLRQLASKAKDKGKVFKGLDQLVEGMTEDQVFNEIIKNLDSEKATTNIKEPVKLKYNKEINTLLESYKKGEESATKLSEKLALIDAQENPKRFKELEKQINEIEIGNRHAIKELSKKTGIDEWNLLEGVGKYIDSKNQSIKNFYDFFNL